MASADRQRQARDGAVRGNPAALRAMLADRMAEVAGPARGRGGGLPGVVVSTGWRGVDRRLHPEGTAPPGGGGLVRGAVHEWIGSFPPEGYSVPGGDGAWAPPVALAAHLAGCAWRARPGRIVWIGAAIRPCSHLLRVPREEERVPGDRGFDGYGQSADDAMLASLLLLPCDGVRRSGRSVERSAAVRGWAAETVMASADVTAVVLDGTGFDFADIRRLQLAAERSRAEGGGPLVVMLRAPGAQRAASVSATRWLVHRTDAVADAPAWRVHLVRCKSPQCGHAAWSSATSAVRSQSWILRASAAGPGRVEQV